MKKILFIVNTMGQAGAETALIALFQKLLRMETYDLSLYALIPRGEMFDKVPRQVRPSAQPYRISSGSVLSAAGSGLIIFRRMVQRIFLPVYRLADVALSAYGNVKLQKSKGQGAVSTSCFGDCLAEGTPRPER